MTKGKWGRIAVNLILMLIVLVVLDIVYEVNFTRLNEVKLHSARLEAGKQLRLLQVSDVHGKNGLNARILSLAAAAKPDIILITGDIVDAATKDFSGTYELVRGLKKLNSALYFVPGNHEWGNGRIRELCKGLEAAGAAVLLNSSMIKDVQGMQINLCGVGDAYTNHDDVDKTMTGIEANKYTIMLSHSPRIIDRLKTYSPDLVLSGHTHGGQVRLPLIGAVVAPGEGFFPKLDKGVFKLEEGKYLYIDSGAGTSILPLRFLNRSQITLITVER